MKNPRLLLLAAIAALSFSNAYGQDPQGAVILNMRNANHGATQLELESQANHITIDDANNFVCSGGLHLHYEGTVGGVGNIPYKNHNTTSGWVRRAALEPGDGYVVYNKYSEKYGRIYIVRWIISALDSKSIIGAQVKYEFPWDITKEQAAAEAREREVRDAAREAREREAQEAAAREKEAQEAAALEKEVQEAAEVREREARKAQLPSKIVNHKDDYVVINGLKWDRKNTTKDGECLDHYEAIEAARLVGKRLPTKEEFVALAALGSTWDDDLKGRWFGEDHTLKSNSKKSIFFPASGYRNFASGALSVIGSYGFYWSSSVTGGLGYILDFNAYFVYPANILSRANGFLPVRCIQE